MKEWDDLTFRFGPAAFLYADKDRIVGFASTPVEAERLVTQFSKNIPQAAPACLADFYLIQQDGDDINATKSLYLPTRFSAPKRLASITAVAAGNGIRVLSKNFVKEPMASRSLRAALERAKPSISVTS